MRHSSSTLDTAVGGGSVCAFRTPPADEVCRESTNWRCKVGAAGCTSLMSTLSRQSICRRTTHARCSHCQSPAAHFTPRLLFIRDNFSFFFVVQTTDDNGLQCDRGQLTAVCSSARRCLPVNIDHAPFTVGRPVSDNGASNCSGWSPCTYSAYMRATRRSAINCSSFKP